MQIPDQRNNRSKRPRDWKVAAVVAAASTVGLSGIALAGSDTPPVPEPIELSDAVSIEAVNSTTTTTRPSRLAPPADTKTEQPTTTKAKKPTTTTTQPREAQRSLSSPFDDAPDDVLRPLPVPGDDSPGTQDSPQDPAPDSPTTPDEPSPDSPATPDEPNPDSPASAQSPQSAQSTDSPDD